MTVHAIAGRFSYGNVIGVEQFSMTRSRGVQPATIQFVVPVVPQVPIGKSAPLQLSDGQNSVILQDCLLQSVDIDYSEGERYIVTLLDQRWRWAYGEISGQYNVVRGGVILLRTKKTPRELAELCLKEMGVARFNLNELPNDTLPEVSWDLETPAVALDNLVTSLGCVVCLQLDGLVRVCKQAVGKTLPRMVGVQFQESIKLVTAPDDIYISADATAWEVSLKIETPFGIERTKGTPSKPSVEQMLPIDKLSYMPPGGWGNEDPMSFSNVYAEQFPDATDREQLRERDRIIGLAQESIWKIFGFKLPLKLPGLPFEITDVNQLTFLPELLTLTTIEYATANQGTQYESRRQTPFVYGKYYDRKDTGRNNVDKFSHKWWLDRKLVYPGGFNIDSDRGVIVFSDPVYSYDSSDEAVDRFIVPELYLRVAVSVKDAVASQYWREVYKKKTGFRNGTKPRWIRRADLRREVLVDPETNKPFGGGDNQLTVEKELKEYAKYEIQKLQAVRPAQATYSGFIPLELDGTIEQVSYAIDNSGETTTTASYGYEHSLVVPSFDERRRIMLLNQFAKRQSQAMEPNRDGQR